MKKRLLPIILLAVFNLFTVFTAESQTIKKKLKPPKITIAKDKNPGPKFHWRPGEWAWRDGTYQWVIGGWEYKPKGKHWVNGHWKKVKDGYEWASGHWSPADKKVLNPDAKSVSVPKQ